MEKLLASVAGAASTLVLPVSDIVSKIIIGTAVGVFTWCITKAITWLFKKIKEKKCSKE